MPKPNGQTSVSISYRCLHYSTTNWFDFSLFQSTIGQLSQPIELVIGNESCDLDSAVSAVGLAFIKYTQYMVSLFCI